MRTEMIIANDIAADLDLDLRISEVSDETQEFGAGTYSSPSSYAIGTRCPICC
ncbi:SCO0268 family class II lanthipeptide [Streptomyces sp. NPDC002012]|uniref:SCO0268 family class II lanthipeptide n=1 Tax=unclassified Streptomyces TaxID=2593676 RepID=UPI002E15BE89|nr:SCO0268 family class II lanthipeptide [Streptomyces sp. NBC_01224]